MHRFFGSVYFAIVLIASTLLFVIAGTFLESWSQSHSYAASFTYKSPIFQLLLALYFVNILLATLNRLPFKKQHVPFVITHIGLLLIFAGIFCKSYFGVQGAMGIAEGTGSDRIFLPDSYALLIEDRETRTLLPFKKEMKQGELTFKLIEWNPHAEERFEGFIKGDFGHLIGLPPFEVDGPPVRTTHYVIRAIRGSGDAAAFAGEPALFFVQDAEQNDLLIAFNQAGERFSQKVNDGAYLIFDKGFGGYGLFADLPESFPPIELMTPLTRRSTSLPPHKKRESLTPRVRLHVSDGQHAEVISLTYDQYALGFKWPILNGKYLVRFQSLEQQIPLHVRLREARQINYLGTEQPYSFESDLLIEGEEATISMNHVFEKRGYRFYLANLVSPPGGAKRVQIVVNYDPVKYILTYPGAIVLALGIVLLYLRRHYG